MDRPRFDVGTATDPGARAYQQDALVANFPEGEAIGIGVLADGMGGHDGGDIASALVVGQAFAVMRAGCCGRLSGAAEIEALLNDVVEVSNAAVRDWIDDDRSLRGMGATLIGCLTVGPNLYWVSVGDSPLYLVRNGAVTQLNEDHSMAPQIRAMVATGMIDADTAASHPERNQLLSAICGKTIERVDLRAEPFDLRVGDVVIAASDGLQTLPEAEIGRIVGTLRDRSGPEMAAALVEAVKAKGVTDQDNVAVMAIKVAPQRAATQPVVGAPDPALEAVAAAVSPRPSPAQKTSAPRPVAGDSAIERAPDDLERALAL